LNRIKTAISGHAGLSVRVLVAFNDVLVMT